MTRSGLTQDLTAAAKPATLIPATANMWLGDRQVTEDPKEKLILKNKKESKNKGWLAI